MIKTIIEIDGMMCGMCETHVNDSVRKNFKVDSVKSSHKTGETVIISKDKIDEEKLLETIGETGYKVVSVKTEPYDKKSVFSFLKK